MQRDYKADKKDYKNWCRRDDRAIGIITSLLDPTIKQTIGEPTSSKALWDLLALNHKDEHAGLAAFFILRHIFDSRYEPLKNGDSKAQQAAMLRHILDLTTENKKLGDDAFADSMMARIILMSLPRHTTWETLTVSLLQSEKLTVKDVTTRLLGEAGRIGSESSSTSPDQALAANHSHEPRSRSRLHNSHMSRVNSKSTSQPSLSQSSSTSKSRCDYCRRPGHTEDDCQTLKEDDEREERRARWKAKKESANIAGNHSDSDSDGERFPEFPDKAYFGRMHVF